MLKGGKAYILGGVYHLWWQKVSSSKTIKVGKAIYEWLENYRENKRLRSFDQAVEWLITEAGYDLNSPQIVAVKRGDS